MKRRAILYLALLAWLSSCGLHPPVEVNVPAMEPAGNGAISISVENFSSTALRTIAPSHIGVADLQSQYELRLTGTTGYQILSQRTVPLTNGQATLDGIPEGLWELTLTAYSRTGGLETLRGVTLVSVTPLEVTPASFTLLPLLTGTGTVRIEFMFSKSIVEKLDKDPATQRATITVTLYDTLGQEVTGTKKVFSEVVPAGTSMTLTYTANDMQLPEGQYTVKLESGYTVQNGSTTNQPVRYEMGYEDILYVEGNRVTSASIELSSTSKELGTPDNPYRRDKATGNGSSPGNQFNTSERFDPLGETLWLYGAAWDGKDADTNGNEILVVDWDTVYNADYYEVEVLVHPFTRNAQTVTANGKFDRVVTTDAAWETLKNQEFTRGNQRKKPSYMRYSGSSTDQDYYKRKSYVISCNDGAEFLSCADKTLAKSLFVNGGAQVSGKANASYRITGPTDGFDNYGIFSYGGVNRGKVGLEGDCGVIGILVPGFSPQTSLVFRVRAVNQYGYSDWVYWKGGKW